MEEQLFHDHSTPRGQFMIRLNRITGFLREKWHIVLPFSAVALIAVFFLVNEVITPTIKANETPSPIIDNHNFHHYQNHTASHQHRLLGEEGTEGSDDGEDLDATTIQPHLQNEYENETNLFYEAKEPLEFFRDFSDVVNPDNVRSITLRTVELHGPSFSDSLKKYKNLKTIKLENVTIHELQKTKRVHLPKLQSFESTFKVGHSGGGEKDDSHHIEGDKETLKSSLFFEKNSNEPWDFDKDVANLGVEIKVIFNGSKLLKVDKDHGELVLNFDSCEDVLKNTNWTYKILTISRCSFSEASLSDRDELHYLNLANVSLSDAELVKILKDQTHLIEFLANVPNATIHLDDLPKSLEFFSATGMNVESRNGEAHMVKHFVISDGVLEETIVSNFTTILPNVDTVAVFGLRHPESPNQLIRNILKTNASRIYMGDLPSTSSYSQKVHHEKGELTVDEEIESEGSLEDVGLTRNAKDFFITMPPRGDSRIGMPLTAHETRFFHFTLSEKSKVLTYEQYLKITIGASKD